jgi:hypothetical protein
MLGKHKIIVDTWCEAYPLLKDTADGEFWDITQVDIDPDAIYIVGRTQLRQNFRQFRRMCTERPGSVVFCNLAEGSQTVQHHIMYLRVVELIANKNMLLMSSGDLDPMYNHFGSDCHFTHITEYLENIESAKQASFHNQDRPYDFLLLNGRLRPHRKYLLHKLRELGLLDRALYTCLQPRVTWTASSFLELPEMNDPEPLKFLPPEYEIERALSNLDQAPPADAVDGFVKPWLFNDTWGDAIVNPRSYADTYFSLVTETVYDYPYSFRTEKIYKPILMAHPWIAVANQGFYRDIRNAGFQTFGHLIDESFDSIENSNQRLDRIVAIVKDICYNGPKEFMLAAQEVCKYNQQHLREYNHQQRGNFCGDFEAYLTRNERP